MAKFYLYKKGVACLLSAALVLTSISVPGGGIKEAKAATPDITSDLIAYYPLDGSLDNIVSKTGGKATLHGGAGDTWNKPAVGNATYGTGKKGKAFDFKGGAVGVDGNNGLELDTKITTDSYTMSFWAQMDNYVQYTSLAFANSDNGGFNLAQNWGGDTFPTLRVWKDGGWDSGAQDVYVDAWTKPALGTWTYITLTYANGTFHLYRNGVQEAEVKNAEHTLATIKNQLLFVGINWWDATIDGRIDDFALYSRALSADDVAALYEEERVDTSAQTLTVSAAGDKTTLTNTKYSGGTYDLDSVQLSAEIVSHSLPMQITWKVNDGAHATVDAAGMVKLTKDATDGEKITVTATNNYGVTGTIELTAKVNEAQAKPVESVTLNKQTASIEEGGTLKLTASVLPEDAADTSVTWKSDNTSVASVDGNGMVTAVKAGTATVTATSKEDSTKFASCKVTVTEKSNVDDNPGGGTVTDESQLGTYRSDLAYKRVGVHDPSVVQDPKTKRYYIFGSHCAWAWSDDLENWTPFTNNITEGDGGTAHTIFKDEIAWCAKKQASYNITGNLWAPDVIWDASYRNADGSKGAWLMYMSINGPDWNSTISLLTSDRLDGNWTYVGPVIQSGMSKGCGPTFDYQKVTGGTDVSRYTSNVSGGGNPTLEAHAIDPCVLYDEKGNLWMAYGSWSGGISMIKLDKETGLRDYSTAYADTNNVVNADGLIIDPYTGYKIAGGTAVSGEGTYIKKIGDYYYMFLSYGGYAPDGGYNMRVFRSSDIKGPYKDVADKDARRVVNSQAGNTAGTTGMRIMSYYKWNFADYGYTAQGHNSATVDEESGKAFVIYHNKYNDGTAAHEVRVHQLLSNEDGWILAHPFEYAGESVKDTGYTQNAITGDYGIMFQKQNLDHANLQCATEQRITLEAGTGDASTGFSGNISGDLTGTWTAKANSPYVTLKIGNVTYKGVLCEGTFDETNVQTMTFTAVGDNQECLWGYKTKDPTVAIRMTIDKAIRIPDNVVTDIPLPTTGVGGSKITWKSNSVAIADDGTVPHLFNDDSKASMTATITNNGYEYSKVYEFTVVGNTKLSEESDVAIKSFYTDTELDMSKLQQGNCPKFDNPFHYTHEDLSNGISISFDAVRTAPSDRLSNIISLNNKLGKMYFTGGSYLGYNDFNGRFMDANLNSGFMPGTDYLADNTKVTIKIEITSKGFTVYQNGTKVYTSAEVKAGTVPGGYSTNNPENTMLAWVMSAPELNFGSGNFWNDLIFKGKISNVVCAYKQPEINVNGTGNSSLAGIYTQDFENVKDISTEWKSTNAQGNLSLGNVGDEHGKYMLYDFTGETGTNSRGAHSYFGDNVTWPENYILEYDIALKAGNNQKSQIAVLTSNAAYVSNNENNGINTGYIFEMSATNSDTWTINGDGSKTVKIPKSEWVHVVVTGSKNSTAAHLKITNGNATLFDDDVTATDTGTIKGLYMLAGRYQATYMLDNIVVKEKDVDYANRTVYDNLLKRAEQYAAVQAKNPIYSDDSFQVLADAIATAKNTVTNTSTQDVIDAQAAALEAAMNGLERAFYTVTLVEPENGTITGLAADGKYFAGDSMSLKAVPDAGFAFGGWKIGDDVVSENTSYSAMVTANITITAVFKKSEDVSPSPSPSASPDVDSSASPSPSPSATSSAAPSPKPTSGNSGGSSGGSSPIWTPSPTVSPKPTTTPDATTKPDSSAKPDTPSEPTVSPKPDVTAKPSATPAPSKNTVKKNKVYSSGNNKYKVTSVTAKKKTVTLLRVTKNKTVKNLKVGATVKIKGQTFKITKIDTKAFINCKKLETVVIGKNITTLGAKCFAGCTNLKKVTFKTKVLTKVGKDAFKKINKKAVIKVPKEKLKKYKKLLKKKVQPSTVKIKK